MGLRGALPPRRCHPTEQPSVPEGLHQRGRRKRAGALLVAVCVSSVPLSEANGIRCFASGL